MFVVDTNVLVAAAHDGSPHHAACLSALDTWRGQAGAWYTTWSVCYEFVRVVTHPRVFRQPWSARQAWAFVEALLATPGFGVLVATPRHALVAAEVFREVPDIRGNAAHDAHIAILMREHGIHRIYTRDTDFHRFPFLDPIDPARLAPPTGAAEKVAAYGRRRRTAGSRASRT